jgi:putative DNA methylase
MWPGAGNGTLTDDWSGANGLAEDVRRYGQWMRDQAEERIRHVYPDATLPDGSTATVIAWIWARTVTCPNPACGADMPLMRSFWLSKKKDRPTWLKPVVTGNQIDFDIVQSKAGPAFDGTVSRTGATCLACQSTVELKFIRAEGQAGRIGAQLACVVAEGDRKRLYLKPSPGDIKAADIDRPGDVPETELPKQALGFRVQGYGMTHHADLFTSRQLVALTTFSDLVQEAHAKVAKDAAAAGLPSTQAGAYADAVATYLAFGVSKAADYHNALCTWRSDVKNEGVGHLFARQAIPMVWDFCEGNPLSRSSGNVLDQFTWIAKVLLLLPPIAGGGSATQANATDRRYPSGVAVSTDPPYYDNIGYADLSDFFYVWLRRSLSSVHGDVTSTMLTPKSEELVADSFRFGGSKAKAQQFFDQGFRKVFRGIRDSQDGSFPMTVIYAYKQSESDESGIASTGWETMLSGLVESGFAITATWPMRSELGNRMRNIDSNALASSIVLACRPREIEAPTVMRSGFVAALQAELPHALRDLQQGAIAPVDLPQAAIGPGMAIFSRYGRVLEADGSPMPVRTALALINQVLDEVLHEQEGDFDSDTRWCVSWFEQYGFNAGKFGDADNLARARDTSVDGLQRSGVLTKGRGDVALVHFLDLDAAYDPVADDRPTVWEGAMHLAHRLHSEGIEDAARFMKRAESRIDLDAVKELGYLLYSICERKRWTESAIVFNGLVTSWLDMQDAMRTLPAETQGAFSFDEGE